MDWSVPYAKVRIRLAHVDHFIEGETEIAQPMNFPILARVQGKTLAPNGCISFRQPYDISRHQQLARFIPNGHVDGGALIGHFKGANFPVLLRKRYRTDVQNDEDYIDVFQSRIDVFYGDYFDRIRVWCAEANSVKFVNVLVKITSVIRTYAEVMPWCCSRAENSEKFTIEFRIKPAG